MNCACFTNWIVTFWCCELLWQYPVEPLHFVSKGTIMVHQFHHNCSCFKTITFADHSIKVILFVTEQASQKRIIWLLAKKKKKKGRHGNLFSLKMSPFFFFFFLGILSKQMKCIIHVAFRRKNIWNSHLAIHHWGQYVYVRCRCYSFIYYTV